MDIIMLVKNGIKVFCDILIFDFKVKVIMCIVMC